MSLLCRATPLGPRLRGDDELLRAHLMAKPKNLYSCTECGGQSPKWQGQCPHCNAWNPLDETVSETASANRFSTLAGVSAERGKVQSLNKVRERGETVGARRFGNAFYECVPCVAVRALALPFRALAAAFGAGVD